MNESRTPDGFVSNVPAARQIVPWDVAGRIGLLFVTLSLVKLAMLIGFRRHLFEIHWRITDHPYSWLNEVAFFAFAALLGFNLWRFAAQCAAAGARVARAANAILLLVGICFILLTLHAGDKNYLYSVMNGTLSWWDLRWYLNLVFFFQQPFLAAWVFVYALAYYALARTGREHRVLHLTTIFATAYTVLFFHELVLYRNVLLVADCLGVACLLAASKSARGWFWLIQPWLWCAFLFLLFHSQDAKLKNPTPEFLVLSGWSIVLFLGAGIFAWTRKFKTAWLWLLPFAFTSFLLLVNTNYETASNYQNLFCLGLALPRYFLGEFCIAATLLALAAVYRRFLPKASLLWLDIVNVLLITLALADLRLTQIMGVRLDWQALQFGASFKMVLREAKPYLPGMFLGLVVLAGLYAVLVGLWRRGNPSKPFRLGHGGKFCAISFLLLGVAGSRFAQHDKAEDESALLLARTSPLFANLGNPVMDKNTFLLNAKQLGMETMTRPQAPAGHAPRDLNVVLIFQESSYNKFLSLFDGAEDSEPLLAKYKGRMELFPNFFTDFAGSVNARFATLAGLYPARDYNLFTLHRVDVKSIFEILHQNGYHCSVFDSCYFDYSGFRDFLEKRGIDAMYDADTMPGPHGEVSVSWGLREGDTFSAIAAQLKQYAASHQKFFLSYFPVAPHYPFDGTPAQFRKYSLKQMGDYTPLYLNEMLYMDWVIASILDQLKESGLLDNTLVVITDDHGEMLGENGGPIGHGWAVTPVLANIPLIIMDPGRPGYRINDTVGSQVDVLPTVLDLLGISVPDNQFYQGVSLYSGAAREPRTIYLNSFAQYGVIQGQDLFCGSRETGAANGVSSDVYHIVNDGARTVFIKTNAANASLPSIATFDTFQENLLQNYSEYQRSLNPLP